MCVIPGGIFSTWNLFSILEMWEPSLELLEISSELLFEHRFDHHLELLSNNI